MNQVFKLVSYCFFVTGMFMAIMSMPVSAQTFPSGFSATNIGSGWVSPVGTAFNNNGTKLFVWEKGGKVYVCNWNGSSYVKQATAVLNIADEVGDWRDHGMLGFALDPDFNNNGFIYVMYVVDRHHLMNFGTGSYNASTNQYYAATIGRITRYKTILSGSNLIADPTSRTVLVGETKSTGFPILHESHGIGSLAFAADGTLLASCGDGASYNVMDNGNIAHTYYAQAITDGIIRANENVGAFRSQMINSLSGKIIRISPVTGNGISSNPFYAAANPRSAAARVWALGFRNPFRMSVKPNTGSSNPATGDLGEIYVGDVGWNLFEELSIIKSPASNCGWPIFEGITTNPSYATASSTTYNKDEANPLFGTGGCTQQYFSFNNLIKQATLDNNTSVYNPCNVTVKISSPNENRFFHRVPALDWKHGTDSARVKRFIGNNVAVAQIGAANSGVTGSPFRGNCAVGGTWYSGTMFPVQYQESYFMADYGGTWIKNLSVQFVDKVQVSSGFSSGWGAILCITENPLDGSLVCVDAGTGLIKRIVYGGNQPPVVEMSADNTFGTSALSVQFTGNASYDPEGGAVTYSWNFGDGSPVSTESNPAHVFSTANSNPKKFVVKLTVKDNLNATSVDSLIISVNNTPPNVYITSPVNNTLYQVGTDTVYSMEAVVTDAEHGPNNLSYVWQTTLRHNNHQHPEPTDTNKVTSGLISRIGCNGDDYYWFIKLTVTDAAGLNAADSVKLLPVCGGPLPLNLLTFSVAAKGQTNLLTWETAEEKDLDKFEIQRSYDGRNFESIGSVPAKMLTLKNDYSFKDENFLDGYIYYRLKMIDIDGAFSYSFIVRVFSGIKINSDMTVSPNPFKSDFLLATSFQKAGKFTLQLIDGNGRIVKSVKLTGTTGFNSFQIDQFAGVASGVYYLQIKQGEAVKQAKVVKVN